ncbi:hypothetical protein, partial [Burkholderia glumae]
GFELGVLNFVQPYSTRLHALRARSRRGWDRRCRDLCGDLLDNRNQRSDAAFQLFNVGTHHATHEQLAAKLRDGHPGLLCLSAIKIPGWFV